MINWNDYRAEPCNGVVKYKMIRRVRQAKAHARSNANARVGEARGVAPGQRCYFGVAKRLALIDNRGVARSRGRVAK